MKKQQAPYEKNFLPKFISCILIQLTMTLKQKYVPSKGQQNQMDHQTFKNIHSIFTASYQFLLRQADVYYNKKVGYIQKLKTTHQVQHVVFTTVQTSTVKKYLEQERWQFLKPATFLDYVNFRMFCRQTYMYFRVNSKVVREGYLRHMLPPNIFLFSLYNQNEEILTDKRVTARVFQPYIYV